MPENILKNPINPLKNLLLRFLRAFYDEKIDYVDKIINEWNKSLIIWIIDILLNGFLLYLSLIGLILIFPEFNINLGVELWHKFIILILLGQMLWVIKRLYFFFRVGYRGGIR